LEFAVTPHDLRRTAATRLFLEDRWTPGEVQAFLGHRDARTTLEIYTKVNPSELPRPSRLSASG
jgi:integrase